MKHWVVLFTFCIASPTYFVNCQNILTNSIFDDIVINRVTDEFLKYVRIAIRDEEVDRIPVPDLNIEFQGPLSISGTFNGSNGSVAYLSTVYRTGDAKLSYGKNTATLALDLGLEELVVDYNNYQAKILSIGPTGKMRATIGRNSIYVTISLYYNFIKCSQDLGTLSMDQFGDIDVRLTGLDPLNWLLDDIASWIATDFRDNIRYLVEDNIKKAIRSAMVKYNLCKFLPHIPQRKLNIAKINMTILG